MAEDPKLSIWGIPICDTCGEPPHKCACPTCNDCGERKAEVCRECTGLVISPEQLDAWAETGELPWSTYEAGAAVAFGLMGMAEAIRANHTPIPWHCALCGADLHEKRNHWDGSHWLCEYPCSWDLEAIKRL